MQARWLRWARDPLVELVVVGALAAWLMKAREPRPRVTVSRETSLALAQREGASEAERARVLAAHVREEILVREGLALGLHHSDTVVRRRLAQAMEMLASAGARAEEPSDEAIAEAYRQGRHAPRPSTLVTLEHVLFSRGAAGPEALEERASAARRALVAGASPATQGDPSLAGSRLEARTRQGVARALGEAVAAHAFEAPLGVWSTPLASPLGLHLVRVEARREHVPTLAEARLGIAAKLREEARERARDAAVQKLFERWEVELPDGRVKGALELVGPGALVAP